MYDTYPLLDELTSFHGHLCPGLAIGYRAARGALERLDMEKSYDEELVAIVENDSCSVDAVQFLSGATFGKGNLIFRDWGKQVFTFASRGQDRAVRVALKGSALSERNESSASGVEENAAMQAEKETADSRRRKKVDYILNAPLEDLFDIREVQVELPPEATIHKSVICDRCGEPVMETRTVSRGQKLYCRDCARYIDG